MKKKENKNIPKKEILNLTKEQNPDDIEDEQVTNFQRLIEQKDDCNPDDLEPGETIEKRPYKS